MSAATLLFPEPECPCGRLLDAMGGCWACDTHMRISPATTDLAGLLAAPSFVHQGAAVITTVDGELTLRVNASGLVLDAERFGGALAAVVLDEPLTVALALAVLRQRGQDEALVAFEAEGGTLTLVPVGDGVRLTVDRRGGAVASVTLSGAATLDLTTELLLSLRRRHWGMA